HETRGPLDAGLPRRRITVLAGVQLGLARDRLRRNAERQRTDAGGREGPAAGGGVVVGSDRLEVELVVPVVVQAQARHGEDRTPGRVLVDDVGGRQVAAVGGADAVA